MEFLNFKGTKFTILKDRKGNPWWVVKELCDYLEIGNITDAIKRLPADCKKKMTIEAFKTEGRGGDNGIRWIINER